jgi:hypothetical protein
MKVIWHDDVSAHRDVEILDSALRKLNECSVDRIRCEPFLAMMSAKRDKPDGLVCSIDTRQSRPAPGELFHGGVATALPAVLNVISSRWIIPASRQSDGPEGRGYSEDKKGERPIGPWLQRRGAIYRAGAMCAGICLWISSAAGAAERPFSFARDTFAFANETVLEFHDGRGSLRHENGNQRAKRFTQHCFVMSRGAAQFRKFARFDPALRPLDDKELAERIRKVTSRPAWTAPLPPRDRITIPGYADLRALSRARADIVQRNIGLGWTTYFRLGNWRILVPHGPAQQARTHAELDRALARGEFFIAYLTNIPESLNINHAVLVYARQKTAGRGTHLQKLRYSVYDPNHAEAPRTLEWSQRDSCFLYQRDWDFVGGKVVVWQVYGRFLQ